jgi:5'-nucleotidase (lipoprotein e(P4) family)
MRHRLVIFITVLAAAPAQTPGDTVNAVLWTQSAAEYHASAVQTYRTAERQLLKALEDPHWTAAVEQTVSDFGKLPPAVILDLDETVIDNSPLQARLIKENKTYNDAEWTRWIKESRSGLVPGAMNFLKVAHGAGVAIFYVTNRQCNPMTATDPTVINLKQLGLPFNATRLFCRTDTSDKSPRRARIANAHRVLLILGDDFNDFYSVPQAQMTIEGRLAAAQAHERWWGDRWFMLPNPMYGNWERALGSQKLDALRQ